MKKSKEERRIELEANTKKLKKEQEELLEKTERVFWVLNAIDVVAEKKMAGEGWANTWEELIERFPDDYPEDNLPINVKNARDFHKSAQKARSKVSTETCEAMLAALSFLLNFFEYNHDDFTKGVRKQLSAIANTKKIDKKEKLYIEALDTAKQLSKENSSWNNVQIAEELIKEESFNHLSLRELKKRILETLPDRNHRQKRK